MRVLGDGFRCRSLRPTPPARLAGVLGHAACLEACGKWRQAGRSCPKMRRTGTMASCRKGSEMERAARRLERCKVALALGLCTALLAGALPVSAQTDDENA